MRRVDHPRDPLPHDLMLAGLHLEARHGDLVAVSAQRHYAQEVSAVAYVLVEGRGATLTREARKALRVEAEECLRRLGYTVTCEKGRDVYDIAPERPPGNAHAAVSAFAELRERMAPEA